MKVSVFVFEKHLNNDRTRKAPANYHLLKSTHTHTHINKQKLWSGPRCG